jgi:hypothetical protein
MLAPRQDQPEDLLQRAIAATRDLPLPDGPSEAVASQTLAALREAAHRPEIIPLQRIYDMPWTSKTIAVLATAASLLVVYTGLSSFTGSSVAFAAVLESMRQAKTMVCDFVTTTTVEKGHFPEQAKAPRRGKISISFADDKPASLIEYEPSPMEKGSRMLFLRDKAYLWYDDTVRVISSAEAFHHGGAEDWLGRLLQVRESPDRELGEKNINGHRAVGFEVSGWKLGVGSRPAEEGSTSTDSEARLRVWVDVEQNLPIRLEIEQSMVVPTATIKIHQLWDNIKWNVALNLDDFRPPSEELLAKAESMKIPAIDEAAFVEFMRAWRESKDKAMAGLATLKQKAQERQEELPAEMNQFIESAALESGYPERLDSAWLAGTFAARATLASTGNLLAEAKPIPKDVSNDEREKLIRARGREGAMAAARVSSEAMVKAQVAAAFYQRLAAEQRSPEYFGATIKPGDPTGVLLKWRLDDGRYRVIYGDLRADTVDTAE